MNDLASIYKARFANTGLEKRTRVWNVLCSQFFQSYVPRSSSILDLACGYGEFINNIEASKKYAVDLNPDAPKFLGPDIGFRLTPAHDLSHFADDSLDRVFTSNFLEHLPDKAACDAVLREVRRVLKPGGQFMILGPNIRYAYREYWDYYDHYLPLSHLSLAEGLMLAGYRPKTVLDRFLPYTMNNAAPTADWIIHLYLRLPFAWKIFGKQFFVVAEK
ncbi:class I SAM-dependent methyltransferase [[Pseudomonas] carboxydohydrogena]|uniref:Class I SAM-dependent methyltransferase n=1 Tax=Afipia carboxydohydrogena TaxID=290 RepID=A0ABY8BNJ6_AFICR|nr:class I SAM-dependent methyltransferase [[Pseudomonas] carboxydohydrogena]WEF51549.1 class I SAM-dependent methyltransferase [[Pseudomonas] carboxydohydrogena]